MQKSGPVFMAKKTFLGYMMEKNKFYLPNRRVS